MFYWSFGFFVSAAAAAFLGFGGVTVSGSVEGIVRGLFVGSVVLSMGALAAGLLQGKLHD